MSPPPRRIAVLIDTSVTFSRQVISGVAAYAREDSSWQILFEPRAVRDHSGIPSHWDVDGVITRVTHRTQAKALRRSGVPVINVSRSKVPGFRFPQVSVDEVETARLAATHLRELGLESLAYYCVPDQPHYDDLMGGSFTRIVESLGGTCSHFARWRRKRSRNVSLEELAGWLHELPRPVGILAWDSVHGHFLREACISAGIRIPEEVAIVCGEDDELFCEMSYLPLSAVDCRPERIGYEAASLLAGVVSGGRVTRTPTHIAPVGVMTRHSTDVLAIDDPDLVQALSYLRRNAYRQLHIRDVLKQVPLSRRALEIRFRKVLGRSPAAELRRLRVARAQELLTTTNWSMPRIAMASGFSQPEIMNRVFRRELQQTPTQYRVAMRVGQVDS